MPDTSLSLSSKVLLAQDKAWQGGRCHLFITPDPAEGGQRGRSNSKSSLPTPCPFWGRRRLQLLPTKWDNIVSPSSHKYWEQAGSRKLMINSFCSPPGSKHGPP